MEHPENYQQEIQQREIERKTKNVVDKREIGVIEEADEAAKEVYDGTVATGKNGEIESGDYEIKLKKGEILRMGENLSLKLTKDTAFEVVGAGTAELAAGELASFPSLYGAIREDLAHDEETELPDGRKVKRKITYGIGGVKTIGEEIVDGVDTTESAMAAGGDVSDEATAKRADAIIDPKSAVEAQNDALKNSKTEEKTASKSAVKPDAKSDSKTKK